MTKIFTYFFFNQTNRLIINIKLPTSEANIEKQKSHRLKFKITTYVYSLNAYSSNKFLHLNQQTDAREREREI